jgi:CRP-like cAMP-binding protein
MQTRHPPGQSPLNNLLLAALPWDEYEQLLPALQPCALEQGRTFHEAGAPERHLYFITSGIVGNSYVLRNGDSATFALNGREGAVGIALLLGAEGATSRSTVIVAGTAWRLRADWAKLEFERNGALQRILLRYTQALMAQIAQTAVCNQHHSLEQGNADRAFPSVQGKGGRVAGRLEQLGLIHCARGHIEMADRNGMQAHACECYAAVRHEYERSAPAPLLQLPETCVG